MRWQSSAAASRASIQATRSPSQTSRRKKNSPYAVWFRRAIAKVVPGNWASAEMSGFSTGVGGLGEPAFGKLPIARQPRTRWPLPKPVLDFVEGNRAVLIQVALGDGVGDTLVTQDISEPVEKHWRVVISNRGG